MATEVELAAPVCPDCGTTTTDHADACRWHDDDGPAAELPAPYGCEWCGQAYDNDALDACPRCGETHLAVTWHYDDDGQPIGADVLDPARVDMAAIYWTLGGWPPDGYSRLDPPEHLGEIPARGPHPDRDTYSAHVTSTTTIHQQTYLRLDPYGMAWVLDADAARARAEADGWRECSAGGHYGDCGAWMLDTDTMVTLDDCGDARPVALPQAVNGDRATASTRGPALSVIDGEAADDAIDLGDSTSFDAFRVARRLKSEWGERHCYTALRGWYVREPGRLWTPDPEALALRARIGDVIDASPATRARVGVVVTELEPMLATSGAWDDDPTLCGLPDDTVLDLATGSARPASASDRITRRLGAVPDFDADAPRWGELLAHICQDDTESEWLRLWCGYCLTGLTREHKLVFLSGPGGGGKSTLSETIRRVVGSYSGGIPEDVFVDGATRHREWLARLDGVRVASIPDLPAGRWRNVSLLKSLSAGDTQSANFMRRGTFDFQPAAKLWISGNTKPSLGGSDSGLARRLVLIPIAKVANPDPHLPQALAAELPAVAAWAVRAAADYLHRGELPPVPPRWGAEAADYLAGEDTIGAWWSERCQADPGAFTTSKDLIADYNRHTGSQLKRATPLFEWIAEHEPPGVTKTRQRIDGRNNPVSGLAGVRLLATRHHAPDPEPF